ncbi:NUDIX hydrolase [Actinomadura algeriensis]|uniref:8-oxo-dGTP pyrophosphatase MutT (NUDIX family) n=1 Tax=Actinomadura algeriensis TaxID=1679523 RepID=A0ABR9JP95_9ACTN|nr:NUDIX domain-containing protein [Actinomadura algeriensis]MBE1532377.1 8-oxo-dGTP pyrophosphatase MutT (NUDIX family) [Actinomadura algeriensis]
MPSLNLRHAVRGIILDEDDRILLCRFAPSEPADPAVWATPGGGVEPGEELYAALRRELIEEVGLELDTDPPHVWHREVVDPGHNPGFDGTINDYYLIRTTAFEPRGSFSDDELAAESISGFRWWSPRDLADYQGPDLFAPRDLASALATLIADGVPDDPVRLGL